MSLRLTCSAAVALVGIIGCGSTTDGDGGAGTAGATTSGATTTGGIVVVGTSSGGTGTTGATTGGTTAGTSTGGTTTGAGTSGGTTGGPIAIDGRVEFFQTLAPQAGIVVMLSSGGGDAGPPSTVSAADGTFHFDAVALPYDLEIIDGVTETVSIYRGLTRPDPHVVSTGLSAAGGIPPNSATLSGAVSTQACLGPNQLIQVCYGPGSGDTSGALVGICATSGDGTYAFDFSWMGTSPITGNLYALQMDQDGGVATGYPGFGRLDDVILASGDDLMDQNVSAAGPVATAVITGTVSAGTGMVLDPGIALLTMDEALTIDLGTSGSSTTDVSALVPVIAGGTHRYQATGNLPGGGTSIAVTRNLDPAIPFNLTVPAPAVPGMPANATAGVTTATSFTWTPVPGSVSVVEVSSGAPGAPKFVLFTTGASMTLDDFSAAAFPLPTSTSYGWVVSSLGPNTSTDGVTNPGGPLSPGAVSDLFYTLSHANTFTTAP